MIRNLDSYFLLKDCGFCSLRKGFRVQEPHVLAWWWCLVAKFAFSVRRSHTHTRDVSPPPLHVARSGLSSRTPEALTDVLCFALSIAKWAFECSLVEKSSHFFIELLTPLSVVLGIAPK